MDSLLDLFPYLTRDCPLNDVSYAAILARIIVSYIGKEEITLTVVNYTSKSADIARSHPNETAMFQHKTCCISTNGSFYVIEDQMSKRYWGVDFIWQYYDKNLRYINCKDINTIPVCKDDNDDNEDDQKNKDNNSTSKVHKYQKYLKTMVNQQWEDIGVYDRRDWEYECHMKST